MAYVPRARKTYRKRKTYNRKKYPTTKKLAQKIKKIENDQEVKNRSDLVTAMGIGPTVSVSTTNYILLNASLDQGTAVPDRIGDEVRITSVSVIMRLTTDVDELKTTNIRCLVFWDRQTNGKSFGFDGTDPTLGQFGPFITPSTASFVYAHYNPYMCGGRTTRYKILYDKYISLNPSVVADFDESNGEVKKIIQSVRVKKFKVKVNKKVKYLRGGDGTGNLDQIMSGSLWLVLLSDPTSPTSNLPLGMVSYKLNYKDE